MISRRSIIAIISVIVTVAAIKITLACGDWSVPFDNSFTFFQSNITPQPEYNTFHFLNDYPFYSYYYSWEFPEDDQLPDGNIEEWYNYCGKAASRSDIDTFMNKFSYEEDAAIAGNKPGSSIKVQANSFCKWLLRPANKEELNYLLYAKKCEPLNAPPESDWEVMTSGKRRFNDTALRRELIAAGIIAGIKTKSDFLRWRYTFQALRLLYYSDKYGQTLELYEKAIGNKTAKNTMYPRCLGLKAGALYKTGKNEQAAYLYSRVFDMNNNLKPSAYQSFVWATDSIKIARVEKLCKNDHEKAVLMVMAGLNNGEFEGLEAMKAAYRWDPAVTGLSMVMTREINKTECWYMKQKQSTEHDLTAWMPYETFSGGYLGGSVQEQKNWEKKKSKYKVYLDGLNLLAQKMASDKKATDKAFCFMRDDFSNCRTYLQLAGKQKMNPYEHDEHGIINMLCIVHEHATIDAATEAKLLPSLEWLESRKDKNKHLAEVYRNFMATILTNKYVEQKDTVKAFYCLACANKDRWPYREAEEDFSLFPGHLLENIPMGKFHEIQNFADRNKSEFDQWLVNHSTYPQDVLKELEGTRYIREMKFEKAVAALSKVPEAELSGTVLPDVLISHLRDNHNWNAADSLNTYNKLQFAKKMLELEKKLETDPHNSKAAYQYANGLYNMSYYGKAHRAYDYDYHTSDIYAYYFSPDRKKLQAYQKEYYGLDSALKYYLIAWNNTTDRDKKARCLFMAARCWQKNCPGNSGSDRWRRDKDLKYYQNSLKNPYFARLYREYRNTACYDEAYTTCSYFRDYARKAKN